MSSTTSSTIKGLTISPKVEGVVYFVFLMILFLGQWTVPSNSPTIITSIFSFIGIAGVIIKYELQSLAAPKIATQYQAILSTFALILVTAGGYISRSYPDVWYAGLIVAVIGAFVAAYKDISGSSISPITAPPITAPPATPSA